MFVLTTGLQWRLQPGQLAAVNLGALSTYSMTLNVNGHPEEFNLSEAPNFLVFVRVDGFDFGTVKYWWLLNEGKHVVR